jgi:hypothetical protein
LALAASRLFAERTSVPRAIHVLSLAVRGVNGGEIEVRRC